MLFINRRICAVPFEPRALFTHLVRVVEGEGILVARQQELSEKNRNVVWLVFCTPDERTESHATFKNTNQVCKLTSLPRRGRPGL